MSPIVSPERPGESRSAVEAIHSLAGEQLGVVTRAQLRKLGLTDATIDSWLRTKRLWPLHRGVYRVGPLAVPRARELAAVMACGPRAYLSHRSAGWLWQLVPDPGDETPVDVSISRSRGARGRRKIHVRRVRLDKKDVSALQGIPITTLPRTLHDLATVLETRGLERVLAQAERLHHFDRNALQALLARNAGRPGTPLLRAWIQNETGPALTRSEAEVRFLDLIRKAQLPAPETNVQVGGYEVDFFWRKQHVVVEVDGFAFHSSARSFENDRRRDAALSANGLTVLRVTWRQVTHEAEATLVRLAQTLARTTPLPCTSEKESASAAKSKLLVCIRGHAFEIHLRAPERIRDHARWARR
jgi:very-short-patch-repair endonuclease